MCRILIILAGFIRARKLMRLFESVREYPKLCEVLKDTEDSILEKVLMTVAKGGKMIYWVIDNMYILSDLKVLNFQTSMLSKIAVYILTVVYTALLFSGIRKFILAIKAEVELRNIQDPSAQEYKEEKEEIFKIKKEALCKILTTFIDALSIFPFFSKTASKSRLYDLLGLLGRLINLYFLLRARLNQ